VGGGRGGEGGHRESGRLEDRISSAYVAAMASRSAIYGVGHWAALEAA
jgi:hypothetical protein